MAAILGISAFYHDSAAALLIEGEIIAAAQEERFSRRKHDESFPGAAIRFCLDEAGIRPEDLDYVAFYEKPLLKFDRLLETYLAYAPAGLSQFLEAMPVWLKVKLHLPGVIRKGLGGGYRRGIVFTGHHEAHAASAFFPSPYDEAAILTTDGVGEWHTATIGRGKGNRIELLKALNFPHSLGLLYGAFTYFCGFKVNSGEYKLMGLAPYGEPKYTGLIYDKLIDLKEDGSFRMDMGYFNYCQGWTMTNRRFERLFGGRPRRPEALLTQREMDMAASIQVVTEEIVFRMARTARDLTGARKLCLGGGVALNCVANGTLLRSGLFDDIWIQPASGDAGGALGAALFVQYQLLENERNPAGTDLQKGSLLGPGFDNGAVRAFLDAQRIPYSFLRVGRRAAAGDCGRDGGAEGSGLVPESNGVRSPRAGVTQHHRRRAQRNDAIHDEPSHQAPGILPAVCAERADRGCRESTSNWTGNRRTCCWWRTCGRIGAAR